MRVPLGVKNPFDENRPFEKQAEFISWCRGRKKRNDDYVKQRSKQEDYNPLHDYRPIQYSHYVGGRGASKTTTAVIDVIDVCLKQAPGFKTFWSSRTNGEIEDVFLHELKKILPLHLGLWKHVRKQSTQWIEWINGHITYLISREVDNPGKRPKLGINVMGGWHDEAATKFLPSKFEDIENAIREPGAPFLFCNSQSTPLENEYEDYVYKPDSLGQPFIVFSSSWDNPHLSKATLDTRASRMDKRTMERELGGRFQKADGLMWPDFEFDAWPNGNIYEGFVFNSSKPFYVGCDLGGSQSAWQLIQYIEPTHPITGEPEFVGKLPVVFAEYTPHKVGIEAVTADILKRYGKPSEVYVGHDVVSRGTTGDQASLHFAQLGWRHSSPKGAFFRKDVQQIALRSLIKNIRGERRIAVAGKKNEFDKYIILEQHEGENKSRGILPMFRRDEYPDVKSSDLFNKDKATKGVNAIEDDRDATLYWVVCCHPPKWVVSEQRAAS